MLKPLTLMALICISTGIITASLFKSSKLYFTGDGGGTDYNIVYTYMFVSLILFTIIVAAVKLLRKSRLGETLKICSVLLVTGIIVVAIFGTLITRFSLHTACDEYGSNTAVCQDEQSSEQDILWKLTH
jgi:uncharacterized membrane protein